MGYHLEHGDLDAGAELLADATLGADTIGCATFRSPHKILPQHRRANITDPDRDSATTEIYSNAVVDVDMAASAAPTGVSGSSTAMASHATCTPASIPGVATATTRREESHSRYPSGAVETGAQQLGARSMVIEWIVSQVLGQVADEISDDVAVAEPPSAVHLLEGIVITPGDDALEGELRRGLVHREV